MRLKAVASLLLVLCVCSSLPGCTDLPEYVEPVTEQMPDLPVMPWQQSQSVTNKTPTPTPTPVYVTNQTPFPTPTPEPVVSTLWNLSLVPYSPESQYTEIYNESLDMKYNVIAFSYNLSQPPMVIRYDILPVNTTYERYVRNQFLNREWTTETVDTYDPNAWAEIKVIDRNTGDTVKAAGYRREYLENFRGSINVNTIGNYQVEIRGNLVTVDVSILVAGMVKPIDEP